MNRNQFLIFFLIFFLSISTNFSTYAIDQSLIGVSEGEEYTFIMERHYTYVENLNIEMSGTSLQGDEGYIILEEGDQFIIKIINETAYIGEDGVHVIDIEYHGSNGTIISSQLLIGVRWFLSDTDWTRNKEQLDESIGDLEEKRINNPDIIYTYQIIDTASEFGYIKGISFSGNDSQSITYSYFIEVRFEKKNGMSNLVKIEETNTNSNNERGDFIHIIRRIPNTRNNTDSSLLPGFTIPISIVTLITLIYRKKK